MRQHQEKLENATREMLAEQELKEKELRAKQTVVTHLKRGERDLI